MCSYFLLNLLNIFTNYNKLGVTKQRSWNYGPKQLGQFGKQETKLTLRKFKHNLKSFWM